jgi:NO-binding membrane sensor protein with MHYT domain
VQHDPKLVLLALGVSAAASFVTFVVFSHLLVRSSGRHGPWLFLAALCAGSGIWAAHVSMTLAVLGTVRGYSALFGTLSFASAVAFAAAGIAIASRAKRHNAALGGVLIGFGIALTHVLGFIAFDFAGTVQWNIASAIRAALLGIVLSAAATLAFREYLGRLAFSLGTVLLTAAIGGALFMATYAVGIASGPAGAAPGKSILPLIFALAAVGGATSILIVGFVAALLDGRATRAIFARLDQLIDALMEGVVIAENGKVISVNARLLEMMGREQKAVTGSHVFGDLLATEPPHAAPGAAVKFDAELHTSAGKPMPVEIVRRPLHALGHVSEAMPSAICATRWREPTGLRTSLAS